MREYSKSYFQNIESIPTVNRDVSMGIGILMVVLYHYNTGLWFQKFFYPGFLGVDIFLFISGYGLCRSFEKNETLIFYKRRIARILPMFFLLAIAKCLIYELNGGHLSLSDWVLSITSLSYWLDGGIFVDWYLSGLLVLYLAFPMLFRLPSWGVILCIATCIISIVVDLEWFHQCLLLRVPIFYLGICCYKYSCDVKFKQALVFYSVAFAVFVFLWLNHITRTYTIMYPLAPFLILAISFLLSNSNKNYAILKWMGKHSIEIYVTNCIVMRLVASDWMVMPSIMYFVLILTITPFVIVINRKIRLMYENS